MREKMKERRKSAGDLAESPEKNWEKKLIKKTGQQEGEQGDSVQ